MSEEKKECYTCRLIKNIALFSLGTVFGIVVGYFFAIS